MKNNPLNTKIELTRQEINILELASQGHSNKEIGDKYNIAECTVKRHRQNIMRKAGIKGKSAMMKFLLRVNASKEH